MFLCVCFLIIAFATRNELHSPMPRCICPGDRLTFTCTVVGDGSTIWRGTSFQCDRQQIALRHSLFTSGGATGDCNDGILAQSLTSVDGCFTSQLNITITSDLNNKTVECAYFNTSEIIPINHYVITLMRGKYQLLYNFT